MATSYELFGGILRCWQPIAYTDKVQHMPERARQAYADALKTSVVISPGQKLVGLVKSATLRGDTVDIELMLLKVCTGRARRRGLPRALMGRPAAMGARACVQSSTKTIQHYLTSKDESARPSLGVLKRRDDRNEYPQHLVLGVHPEAADVTYQENHGRWVLGDGTTEANRLLLQVRNDPPPAAHAARHPERTRGVCAVHSTTRATGPTLRASPSSRRSTTATRCPTSLAASDSSRTSS